MHRMQDVDFNDIEVKTLHHNNRRDIAEDDDRDLSRAGTCTSPIGVFYRSSVW